MKHASLLFLAPIQQLLGAIHWLLYANSICGLCFIHLFICCVAFSHHSIHTLLVLSINSALKLKYIARMLEPSLHNHRIASYFVQQANKYHRIVLHWSKATKHVWWMSKMQAVWTSANSSTHWQAGPVTIKGSSQQRWPNNYLSNITNITVRLIPCTFLIARSHNCLYHAGAHIAATLLLDDNYPTPQLLYAIIYGHFQCTLKYTGSSISFIIYSLCVIHNHGIWLW